ncbi:hypothetical protein A2635_05290 [Candidatus Peribacteria bacterium RIFCSPHIGHO2_01_FULL_51_9]|nr:MAG: hypothetical protein A2635_05290 [Candidatus Peribacteria bacterium RIFCSPHIGHO2_01_FULL_51_9]
MPNLDKTDTELLFQCECKSDYHRVTMRVEQDPAWNDNGNEWLTFDWINDTSTLWQAIQWWWKQKRCWWMNCLLTKDDARRLRDSLTKWLDKGDSQ